MTQPIIFSLIMLASVPAVGLAQSCVRAKHGDPFYGQEGTVSIARGETRTLFRCSVRATEMTLIFTPSDGLTVDKVVEMTVPERLAKVGVRPAKGHHIFSVTVSAAPDAALGKRPFVASYTGSEREKQGVLSVASHLPELTAVEAFEAASFTCVAVLLTSQRSAVIVRRCHQSHVHCARWRRVRHDRRQVWSAKSL